MSQTEVDDRWASAIASVVDVLRECAVMMENGEVPMLRGPLALLRVAEVLEGMPAPEEISNGQ